MKERKDYSGKRDYFNDEEVKELKDEVKRFKRSNIHITGDSRQ